MKTLTCPKCGTEIPLEEAVTHQIREELVREFQARSAQREKAFVDREAKLATLQTQVDKSRENLDQEIERRIHAQADQLRAQARKQAEAALELQLQDLRVELGEKEQKLAEATRVELEMRQKQRALESRQQALDLEVARKVDEEREKIRRDAATVVLEEQHLRLSARSTRTELRASRLPGYITGGTKGQRQVVTLSAMLAFSRSMLPSSVVHGGRRTMLRMRFSPMPILC